jgi:steroid delta-isomerase-like uncharacterized protein
MSTEENKALVRRHAELIVNKDLETLFAEISPDFVDHELQPGMPPGIEGARQFFSMLVTAFPDLDATLEEVLADGDKVATRMTVRGTQNGPFLGIPPTGKHAAWSIMDIYRIGGGKVVEHWGLTDQVAMLQQLGVMPPPRGNA